MRVFTCGNCGQLVFFHNSDCLRCRSPLGYVHDRLDVVALTEVEAGRLVDLGSPVRVWQRCGTAELTGCNWLVPVGTGTGSLCASCCLTRTRPGADDPDGLAEFRAAEMAKRRLVFQLAELELPLRPRDEGGATGVAFDLLSSTATKIITGHDDGVITLDLAEADDQHRERLRLQLNEPYRTVLGHFRHEIGHYYWPILVHEDAALDACRALFGDDRADYGAAVAAHYDEPEGPATAWLDDHISRYATMHPYEDWAESFAHYLHILDTLETAVSFGIGGSPARSALTGEPPRGERGGRPDPTRPDGSRSFGQVVDHWLELSYGLNQINQSMGGSDLYPFVLAPAVIRKLAFIDRLVRNRRG
jgi:hypothetical protein